MVLVNSILFKSSINEAIKPEFSVDGNYFVKISPCKMCMTEASGWSSHTKAVGLIPACYM